MDFAKKIKIIVTGVSNFAMTNSLLILCSLLRFKLKRMKCRTLAKACYGLRWCSTKNNWFFLFFWYWHRWQRAKGPVYRATCSIVQYASLQVMIRAYRVMKSYGTLSTPKAGRDETFEQRMSSFKKPPKTHTSKRHGDSQYFEIEAHFTKNWGNSKNMNLFGSTLSVLYLNITNLRVKKIAHPALPAPSSWSLKAG